MVVVVVVGTGVAVGAEAAVEKKPEPRRIVLKIPETLSADAATGDSFSRLGFGTRLGIKIFCSFKLFSCSCRSDSSFSFMASVAFNSRISICASSSEEYSS
ncbi:hypothetical protein BJ741DRAFT_627246 [Chytriomyces cf. hyalinus JEL632]|nr:hypothetical protein BJ741DRAFT_627246 [Chytriomyces cf. hyalinus JEL632]